jgi:beta-lactam-binding protein with PASTA domain
VDATRALQDLQLRPRIEEMRRPDPTVPVGRVVQQDPAGGEDARPQRAVKVWLSAGPHTTVVPSLVGQSERTARIRLDQDGIMAVLSEIHSDDYAPDTVVGQDPPPPARSPRVSLLVNRGPQPPEFVMPDVVGMDAERVAAALTAAGMRVTTSVPGAAGTAPALPMPPAAPPAAPTAPTAPVQGLTPAPPATVPGAAGSGVVPAGGHAVVLRQQPAAGSRIVQGGTIALEVNR